MFLLYRTRHEKDFPATPTALKGGECLMLAPRRAAGRILGLCSRVSKVGSQKEKLESCTYVSEWKRCVKSALLPDSMMVNTSSAKDCLLIGPSRQPSRVSCNSIFSPALVERNPVTLTNKPPNPEEDRLAMQSRTSSSTELD